jgi:ribonuclease J
MVKLTFYGGANEIGGNKILLEDKGAKIYLDFGQSFDFGEDYFYEWLQPRKVNGLEVMFEFDLMPKVQGIYSEDVLRFTKIKYKKPKVDGILISHGHSDHVGHLPYLDTKIPIYMGHGTKTIYDTYSALYPGFTPKLDNHNVNLFKSSDKFKIKHLTVDPTHVEHSIPGAYGHIIHTSKGPVVYSGDFRLHGPKSGYTEEFIKKCKKAKPYAMLIEGTRMEKEQEHNFTEKEVGQKVDKIVKGCEGTVFAYFSMSNIDRFFSFYKTAKKNGRILVVNINFAYILDCLQGKISGLPNPRKDIYLKVYHHLAGSCTFCAKDYHRLYERNYIDNKVTYKDIKKSPKKYIVHMNFTKLMELVYIQPKNAEFIYSSSEHFLEGEDNKKEKEVMMNWMKHFGIKFHKAHCSGHADKKGLQRVIEEIRPKILIPIHTTAPKEFEKLHKDVKLPKKDENIEI